MQEGAGDPFAPFAEVYDRWVETAPVTVHHVPFYVDEFVRAGGPCVEIGVGNGRITIDAARRGVDITGVDVSPAMLALCRERAAAAGLADRIRLVHGDMRDFALPFAPALVAIPFHTIQHAVTLADKRAVLRNLHARLAPGGRLLFDAFVLDRALAESNQNVPRLRWEGRDEATGEDALMWVVTTFDFARQTMRIVAWTEWLDAHGVAARRRYCRMDFSWVDPDQVRALLDESGFDVAAAWGGFDRRPLDAASKLQVWDVHRRG